MKILYWFLMLSLLGVAASAQTAPKVVAEISANADRAVKGAPFSAEAVSESVQTLADGNRIVRRWTNKLYRNSEGRFRREGSGLPGSVLGAGLAVDSSTVILDPVAGSRFMVDSLSKTVRAITLTAPSVKLEGQYKVITPDAVDIEKLKTEIEAAKAVGARIAATAPVTVVGAALPAMAIGDSKQRWESRTEQLGVQNFEGVDAEGTRTVTTIPEGAIGNERPIEIVYERWYSKELQQIVYSKHSDPRFGEQTYRLTNIVRSEPDPSLFEVPNGYRIQTEPATTVYTPARVKKVAVERMTQVKAIAPAKPQQ